MHLHVSYTIKKIERRNIEIWHRNRKQMFNLAQKTATTRILSLWQVKQ